jgi:DNA processing protein
MDLSLLKRHQSSDDLVDEELAFWLAFVALPGPRLGHAKILSLLEYFGSLKDAWQVSATQLKEVLALPGSVAEKLSSHRQNIDPHELLVSLKRSQTRALDFYHPLYPAYLREIHDPPLVLFVKGELKLEDLKCCVAVVGTRRPTAYGQRLAKQIAKGLAESGVTVVSGMAIGVDSFAHYGAIEGKGRTLAVLGCSAELCYPSSNKPLYSKLVSGECGAVLSEYLPGASPEKWRFPARNRLISGISQALVVVEAGETSGSLITAKMAFEQSRAVFAVPGRVDSPMSLGTNGLIAKNMAQLLVGHEDVLKSMEWVSLQPARNLPTLVELYGVEKDVFEHISSEPVHFDHLAETLGMQAGELSATLTMLELAGVITRLPGDWYARDGAIFTL